MVTLKLEKYSIWYLRVAASQFFLSFYRFCFRQHPNRNHPRFETVYRVEIGNEFTAHLVFESFQLLKLRDYCNLKYLLLNGIRILFCR